MRRLLSIVLTLSLTLPLIGSLLQAATPAQVPLCCRKGGTHHCMQSSSPSGSTPQLRGVCPAFPRTASTAQTDVWITTPHLATSSASLTQPFLIGQVEAGYRIALGRSGWKRGPPQLTA